MRQKKAKRLSKLREHKEPNYTQTCSHDMFGNRCTPFQRTASVVDVRDFRKTDEGISQLDLLVKAANGNVSRFIPSKFGYGVDGPVKY